MKFDETTQKIVTGTPSVPVESKAKAIAIHYKRVASSRVTNSNGWLIPIAAVMLIAALSLLLL